MSVLAIFVIAELPLNIQQGKTAVDGYLENHKFYLIEEQLLSFRIYSNHGINNILFTILANRNESVKGFDSPNNKFMEYLPEQVAEKFPNLIAYQGINCSVKSISYENFRDLNKLEALYLDDNQIEFIDSGVFQDLTSLRFLDLNNNKIKFVSQVAFSNLKKIERLYLKKNELKSFLFELESLSQLRNFSMSDNQLSILPDDHFKDNKKLEWVWFKNNKIKYINPNLFDNLNALKQIDLENNTCINSFFYTRAFPAMKIKISSDC